MAFSTSFIYEAIDKISPNLEKMGAKAKVLEKKLKDSATKALPKFKQLNGQIEKTGEAMKKAGGFMTKAFTLPVVAGFTASILAGGKYEDALASLSAITGLQGKALNDLSTNIMKTSTQFGIGASDIAKGMELIGSKQPKLLKTPALLLDVAKASSVLAKASGQDLPESASNLLDVMNTFNVDGTRALEVVNLLASASKFGSAQIPFVTSAMKNAGSASKLAGVNMAELVASIEIISEKTGLASERIGTGLKTAFLKLEKEGPKKFRPSVVGLQKALENMNEAGLKTAQMSKLLGDEAIVSFPALIANAEAFKKMTKNIQGTNTGVEQAGIRMSTTNERIKRLWESLKNKLIKVFFLIQPTLNNLIDSFIKMSTVVAKWMSNNKALTVVLLAFAGVLASIGPILLAVGQGMVLWAKASAVLAPIIAGLMGVSFAPLIAPILAIVAGVTAVTSGILILWRKSAGFRSFFKTMWSSFVEEISPIGKVFSDTWNQISTTFGKIGTLLFGANEGVEKFSKSGATVGIILGKAFNIALIPLKAILKSLEWGMALVEKMTDAVEGTATKKEIARVRGAGAGGGINKGAGAIGLSREELNSMRARQAGIKVQATIDGSIKGPDGEPITEQKSTIKATPQGASGAGVR
jgi:TP901 family phage tail tape measure protein